MIILLKESYEILLLIYFLEGFMKIAIITGITGQDGAYLSKLLLSKKYKVIGFIRNSEEIKLKNLEYLNIKNFILFEECNLLDLSNIIRLFTKYKPNEVYNLAAQSSVGISFEQPLETMQFNILSVLNILEAIKLIDKNIKLYQASSSEMYGKVNKLPITEDTVFHPLSPYAVSKATAHWSVVNYREAFNLFACCGILFNHESYLRNNNFFVKKVLREAINIKYGKQTFIKVGNIDIKRDFGYAPDYVEAIYLMLQQSKPDDYVICSGKSVQLKEIIIYVFNKLNISINKIIIDTTLYRPLDIIDIYGDNTNIIQKLGWCYNKTFFDVIDLLLEEELKNFN